MSKTFKCAGVSRRNGTFKARFASDMTRVKVLAKTGSKDIDMIELKHPMTKEDAVAYLLKINFDNGNAEIRAALEADLAKRQPKAKAVKPAKAPKAKVAKSEVSKAEITKQLADLEDAPF